MCERLSLQYTYTHPSRNLVNNWQDTTCIHPQENSKTREENEMALFHFAPYHHRANNHLVQVDIQEDSLSNTFLHCAPRELHRRQKSSHLLEKRNIERFDEITMAKKK